MAGHRPDEQIERDRAMIVALWVKGVPIGHIAQQLEIERTLVSKDLNAVRKQWAESSIFNFNEQISKELARLDEVEAEAWRNLELSKQPQRILKTTNNTESEKTTGTAGVPPSPFNTDRDTTGQAVTTQVKGIAPGFTETITLKEGNPKWLDIVLGCIAQRCKLLRLVDPDLGALTVDSMKVYAGFDPDRV